MDPVEHVVHDVMGDPMEPQKRKIMLTVTDHVMLEILKLGVPLLRPDDQAKAAIVAAAVLSARAGLNAEAVGRLLTIGTRTAHLEIGLQGEREQ